MKIISIECLFCRLYLKCDVLKLSERNEEKKENTILIHQTVRERCFFLTFLNRICSNQNHWKLYELTLNCVYWQPGATNIQHWSIAHHISIVMRYFKIHSNIFALLYIVNSIYSFAFIFRYAEVNLNRTRICCNVKCHIGCNESASCLRGGVNHLQFSSAYLLHFIHFLFLQKST